MKQGYFQFTKRIFFVFFLGGALTLVTASTLQDLLSYSIDAIYGPDLAYDHGPVFFRLTRSLLGALPLIVFVGVLVTDIRRRNFSRTISYFFGFVFALALLTIYFFRAPQVAEYMQRQAFDSAVWKSDQEVHDTMLPVRQRMVDDLLKKKTLVGMTKGDIDFLLGPPTYEKYFPGYDYAYVLGPERGFGVDIEFLGIRFDEDVAIEATILRD